MFFIVMFTKRKKNKYAVWPVEVEVDTALGRGNRHLTDFFSSPL